MRDKPNSHRVHTPEECAAMLGGITVKKLVKILKAGGYAYTSLMPGSTPWGRGRQVWGLTDDQLGAVLRGQAKRFPSPEEATSANRTSGLRALGWDGVSRLRRSRP
jgi:hypothetical protein